MILIVAVLFFKIKNDKNGQRYYKQGIEFYKEKKYQDAYYNFKQIGRFNALYKLSLIKQYQCAKELQDTKTAYSKISQLAKLSKKSPMEPWVLYQEAEMYRELHPDKKENCIKKYENIQKKFPDSDFSTASSYKIASICLEDDKNKSKIYYLEYLKNAPSGKFAIPSLEALSGLKAGISQKVWEIIADAYFATGKYQEAINCYLYSNFSDVWYKISKTYKYLGNYQLEKDTILKGLQLKISSVEEKDIDTAIDRLSSIARKNKTQLLEELYNVYPNSYIIPTVIYKLACSNKTSASIRLYKLVSMKYPNSYWASNSLWEVFWYNWSLSRYKTCDNLAKRHETLYPDTQDAPRIMYWHAKALLKEGKNQNARDLFYKVIKRYPQSYYAFLSAKALKGHKTKMITKKPVSPYKISALNKHLFKDKTLLALAENEDFETLENMKISDGFVEAYLLYQKGKYPSSINCAKKALNKKTKPSEDIEKKDTVFVKYSDWELKLLYPVMFENEINKYSKQFNESPYLILSLIREESHFDKNAKSSAGAKGLMQLMPATAQFIEHVPQNEEIILNPELNIKMGTKYFNYLKDFFDGNDYLAISGYNGGPGNIKKWLNNPAISTNEIDVFVENIPYYETKNYIKKVLASYWVYTNIYSIIGGTI